LYHHRKLLESEKISATLNVFLDVYFGFRMQQEFAHRRLFDVPHPRRSPLQFLQIRESEVMILPRYRLIYGTLARPQPAVFIFMLVTEHFHSLKLVIDISDKVEHSQEMIAQLTPVQAPVFASWNRSYLLLDRPRMTVSLIENCVLSQKLRIQTETNLIAFFDGDSIVYCPTRSTVATEKRHLCETKVPITHLAANPQFRVFALATMDGAVGAYSLRSGQLVVQSSLNQEITHLIITEMLGFIVAFGDGRISLLSVNGELIKTVDFLPRVLQVYQFHAFNGFDFVAFETEDHQVGFFEAFFPENIVIFCQLNEGTVQIAYAQILTAFLLLLEGGTLKIVGQSININPV
jgi:hypothetical protein